MKLEWFALGVERGVPGDALGWAIASDDYALTESCRFVLGGRNERESERESEREGEKRAMLDQPGLQESPGPRGADDRSRRRTSRVWRSGPGEDVMESVVRV